MCSKFTRILLFIIVFIFCHYSDLLYASPFTPPVINNLNNDAVTYTEGNARVFLDAGGNADVTAGTAPDFNQALLTVEIASGSSVTEDNLGVYNTGNAAGQIGVSGNEIYYGGTLIATFTGGATIRPLKIRFNANATAAAIAALLRQITYYNTNPMIPTAGSRTVSYLLSDGYGSVSTVVNVNLQVNTINHAPVVSDQYYVIAMSSTISMIAPGLKYNDFDPDGDATTFSPVALPLHGSLSLSNSGAFTYTPDASFIGLDSFTYRLVDPNGATSARASALFFIGSTNVAPVTAIDNYTINQNEALYISDPYNGGVLSNDNDNNSGSVRIYNKAGLVTAPAHGQITMYPNGTFKYMPNAGYTGTESFVYQNCDAQGACANGTINIVVQAVNNAPNALDDYYEISHLATGADNVLANDQDADGHVLTASLVTAPAHGSLVLNANGTFSYTPDNSYDGIDRFLYQVCDNGTPSMCDTALVVFNVNNANLRPVITAPATDTTNMNQNLIFNTANGNLVTVSDVDAGTGSIQVTLTATHGLLTLPGTAGLIFLIGSGTSDATTTFIGSLADINNALSTLIFTPVSGYVGNAVIAITVDDLGLSGTGGAQTATSTINIEVKGVNPVVTTVQTTNANGTYKTGDVINVTVTFDQAVTVNTSGGSPSLLMETGATDQPALYVSGSGTNTITFAYTVQAGDASADLDYASTGALVLNGAFIQNSSGYNAVTTLPTPGSANSLSAQHAIAIDGIAPAVTGITRFDATPTNAASVSYTVTFSENVTNVAAADFSVITVNGTATAVVTSVNQVNAATYTITIGSLSGTGILRLAVNSSTNITDIPGNVLSGSVTGDTYTIDRDAPVITGVTTPADGIYRSGDALTFTVHYNEPVVVNSAVTAPAFSITLNTGGAVYANYVTGSGSNDLVFNYTVQTGNEDTDGIGTAANLVMNANSVLDTTGNAAGIVLNNMPATSGILVDAAAPQISITSAATGIVTNAFTATFTFTENVTGFDINDILVTNGRLSGFTAISDRVYTVLVTPVVDGALTINVPANSATDIAGNGNQAATAFSVTADITAPSVTITMPVEATESFTATIHFSEAVFGFTLSDISSTNAVLSNLTSIAPGVYTVLVTPVYGDQVTLAIGAAVATDAAGNFNTASTISTLIAHATYHIGKVYPNPASEYVNIKLEGIVPHQVNVRLTDLQGRIVKAGYMPVNNNLITVNVSTLTTGVYVLMVRTVGTQTFKILVSR